MKCRCGTVKIVSRQKPLFRFYCHCSICREYNSSTYADVSVFRKKEINHLPIKKVKFRTYKKFGIPRGKCIDCGSPTIETLNIPLLPKLILIPGNMIHPEDKISASFHMYYHYRVKDFNDGIIKYARHLSSQFAFAKNLILSLLK